MRSTLGSARWLGLLAVLLAGSAWADTMDQYPIGETPVYGTVTGSYTNLMASDNVYEAIKEVMNGTSYSWCEWKWTFNVLPGTAQQFRIEAYRPSNSDSDNFQFAYSTDGTNYTNTVSITKTSDNNTDQTYSLPAGTSGTVYVRVRDTNRSNNRNSLDTVYIDRMRIVRTYTDASLPAAVSNLSVSNITANSVQLNWTAPSDADSPCTAYDIRYSTSAITAGNFSSATQVTGAPTPASPGTNQNMTVSGLSGNTTYYFAMKTADSHPNWSAISNLPSATTLDTTAPAAIANLATSSPTGNSITLSWTAPSDPDSACTAYDIRYSTSAITAGNFSSATQVTGAPAPASGGTNQNMVVSGLSGGTTYYFAMKTSDAVPNWSALSNVASGTTTTISTITFVNNILTYGSPSDLDSVIDPAGLNDVAVSYGVSKASFQALNPKVVAFNGAPAPGTPLNQLVAYYTTTNSVTFTFGTPYNYGSYTSYSRGAFSGTVSQDAMSTAPVTNGGITDWLDATITSTGGQGVVALGFCVCFRDDQAVDAGQAIFTLSDSTTEAITLPALGGANPRLVFIGYQAPTGKTITRVQASHTIAVGGAWVSVDDWSFVMGTAGDTTPPAAVANLAAGSPTSGSLTLTWTAPGDDGSTGTATSYDIRYSTSTINDANWASATQVSGEPAPMVAGTNQNMVVSGLSASTTYYFAMKTSDEVPNVSALSNVASGTTSGALGTGLKGDYYDNMDFSGFVLTRTDATVDFDWGNGSPDPSIGADTFSVRWTGQVQAQYTETYTFYTVSDDGVRLWVNSQQLVNNWTDHASTENSGTIALTAGQKYGITMEYYENGGGAVARLLWSSPSTAKATIPQTQLFPATGGDTTAPAAVANLAAGSPTTSSIQLTWTAPGDDGNTGTAAGYDIRYSTSTINEGNWASATQVTGEPAPQVAGTNQSVTVAGLAANTTYYFAIKTSDEVPNVSAISNIASGTTSAAADTTPPAAVSNLATGSITASSITLSWTAPGDDNNTGTAATYDIRYSTSTINDANFSSATQVTGVPAPQVAGTNQNVTVSGLSGDTTYYFAMKTADEVPNWSTISNVPSTRTSDTVAPAAVSNLAAGSPTAGSVVLSWTAPGDNGSAGTAATYDIRYSTSVINAGNWASATQVTGEPTPLVAGSNQNMTVTGLSADTTYYFAIETADEVPNWSTISNVASGKTSDTVAPAAVNNLATSSPTASSIVLSWTAPGDNGSTGTATTYDIRYSTSTITAGNWASATQVTGEPAPAVAGTNQNMTITGLSGDTTYYFAIETADEVPNWSSLSNVPSGKTSDTVAPAAVSNLATSSPTSSSITLSWTAPGDNGSTGTATTYDIRYSTSTITAGNWASATQVTGEPAPAVAGTNQNMVITGLSPSTTYYFAIETADEVPNWSALSNVPSGTTSAASQAPVTVLHIGGNTSGWRGAYNISPTYCFVSNWGTSNADAEIGQFDRSALQSAIDTIYTAYHGWDAQMVISQVNWNTTQPPSGLTMVAGSADLDPGTVVWQNGNAFGAGNGNWTFNGTGYSDFYTAINAGTASGRTVVTSGMPYTSVWDTGLPAACWDVIMDVPESLINAYMQNPTALGLFASCTDATGLTVHANDQWSHQANIRIVIQQPPQTAPWIGLNTFAVNKTIALSSPTDSQTINVTNAGTGTLNWTATENPDVTWLSISGGSGTGNGSFTANFNVTGLTAGNTYTTKIRVAATGAGNTPQDINVSIKVVANASPIIQLAPTSLSYDMAPSDAPLGQNVTVTNAGLGTLNWTAAVQGSASWLTLTNASGTSGQAFTATVNPSSLSMGTYTANIQVTAPGATNSPQTVPVSLMVRQKDANITTANSYDDAWENGGSGWVQHCTNIKNAWSGKTDGFVVQVGDSITYAAPYGSWARYGQGKSAADTSVCSWMHADINGDGTNNSNNGWWLAYYDVSGRPGSYTARSGIRADQYLAGLTYPDLPGVDQMFTSGFTNPDGKQYRDAQICVLMLGTNDVGGNRTSAAFIADLGSIVDKMQAANVIVAVSTLPPRYGSDTAINDYNTQIRSMAQTKAIPLIDFYQEVVRRRPNGTWMNTLISSDGVHPSADYGGSHADSDPYANNGDALSNSGYLLRDWLSVQKVSEIKTKVFGATTWNVSTTSALQSAVASYAPGDTINIAAGTYTPTSRLTCNRGGVTIKGATGNRNDVIIQGPGMAVNTEPTEMFDLYSSDVTIRDLTIQNVYYHGVHIRAEVNVDRTHVQNVHTLNCGERHIKGSFDNAQPGNISDDVLIENCLLEQTQANTNHTDNDYIAGIDVMGVNNIIIRDNVFKGIVGPTGGGRAAIFIWHHNTNPTIERNQIYGCDRGISMCNPGWAGPGAGATGGIIRNNMIVRGVNIALELCFTDSFKIYCNTIYSDDAGYYRTVSIYDDAAIYVTNNLQFKYNIIRGLIQNTSAGSGNVTETGDITGSTPATNWFVNPAIGDLHLTSSAIPAFNIGVLLPEVPTDFDKQNRSSTPDIGADESSY